MLPLIHQHFVDGCLSPRIIQWTIKQCKTLGQFCESLYVVPMALLSEYLVQQSWVSFLEENDLYCILPQTPPLPQESSSATPTTLGEYPISPPITPPPLILPCLEFLVLPTVRITCPTSSSSCSTSSNSSSLETTLEGVAAEDNQWESRELPFAPPEPSPSLLLIPLCCRWCLELGHSYPLCSNYMCPICLLWTPGHGSSSCPNSPVDPDSSGKEWPISGFWVTWSGVSRAEMGVML